MKADGNRLVFWVSCAMAVALVSGGGVARADTVVQLPLGQLLTGRTVTTLTNGMLVPWTVGTYGTKMDGFETAAASKFHKDPAALKTLPDDGTFPENELHPLVVLNFSNDADPKSQQTLLIPQMTAGMFMFPVPAATYSKMFLFFSCAYCAKQPSPVTITLGYGDNTTQAVTATLPDFFHGVTMGETSALFNLALDQPNWRQDGSVYETNGHTITGVGLQPMAGKVLQTIKVERTMGGWLTFWGATGVATSAVAGIDGGATTGAAAPDAGGGATADAGSPDTGAIGGPGGASGSGGATSGGSGGISAGGGGTGAPAGGGMGGPPAASSSSGGGCSVGGEPPIQGFGALAGPLALVVATRLRRRRARSSALGDVIRAGRMKAGGNRLMVWVSCAIGAAAVVSTAGAGAARADTVVQVPLGQLLNSRFVTTMWQGMPVPWIVGDKPGGSGFETAAASKFHNDPATLKPLPDDGAFPADANHPLVVLNVSNDADPKDPQRQQTYSMPQLQPGMFMFQVPAATYSKMYLFFISAYGTAPLTITLGYSDTTQTVNLTVPDFSPGIKMGTETPTLFNLAADLPIWAPGGGVAEPKNHTITGVELGPMAGKVLQTIKVERTTGGWLTFWGATGVATSAVVGIDAGAPTDAAAPDAGGPSTIDAGSADAGTAGGSGGASGNGGATGGGSGGATAGGGSSGTSAGGGMGGQPAASSSGGGCSVGGEPRTPGLGILAAALVIAGAARLRRRRAYVE